MDEFDREQLPGAPGPERSARDEEAGNLETGRVADVTPAPLPGDQADNAQQSADSDPLTTPPPAWPRDSWPVAGPGGPVWTPDERPSTLQQPAQSRSWEQPVASQPWQQPSQPAQPWQQPGQPAQPQPWQPAPMPPAQPQPQPQPWQPRPAEPAQSQPWQVPQSTPQPWQPSAPQAGAPQASGQLWLPGGQPAQPQPQPGAQLWQPGAQQAQPQSQPGHQPAYPWARTAPWQVPARQLDMSTPQPRPERRRPGWPQLLGAIVATALLSATFSAGATYVAISAAAPRATGTPLAETVTQQTTPPPTAAATANAPTANSNTANGVVSVVNTIRPSVVTIEITATSNGRQASGAGSGIVVSADGLILTNNHVVQDTTSITVALSDGRVVPATVVVTDPTHDLAVIRAQATGLTAAKLGNSAQLQVGQEVVAVGDPLGTFTGSVTRGIVSGLDRDITAGDRLTNSSENLHGLIQTDAAINPGNSGGPLLDMNGNVVGVVVAGSTQAQGIGFAVPINDAKSLIAQAASK